MGDRVTLSVVVLSYNNEQYIEDCLKSIEKQNIDSYEVFVVDDSSTDNSAEVINNFIKDKPQFQLIQKPNSGGAVSSQIGIAKATGKYLALVDSDDIVGDGAYQKMIDRIEQDGSDFAAGLPMRMVNGFMNTSLASNNERNTFAQDRVLSTDEEIEAFTETVFYWNAVYKTDFIKENAVEMPTNLLIADRIFVYKAVMCAKKISILKDVVYYWRRKNNSNKISLMDQVLEYHMISDRCDSFQSQIKLCVENFEGNAKFNKAMWEKSIIRLYYPLMDMASDTVEDRGYKEFKAACIRYRYFLVQYKGFFIHLIGSSDIPFTTKYITEKILTKKYKELFEFLSEKVMPKDVEGEDLDPMVYNSALMTTNLITVKHIEEEDGRLYIKFQLLANLEKQNILKIERIFIYNRYFSHKQIDLEYDRVERRVDITDLPFSTYAINIVLDVDGQKQVYIPNLPDNLGKVYNFTLGDKIVTYNSGFAILTIQKKNRFTLVKKDDMFLLGVNEPEEIEKIFIFNVNDNKRYPLEKMGDFYVIDYKNFNSGDNIMLYKNKEGMYTTVRKKELSNTAKELEQFEAIFDKGRIDVEVE